MSRSFDPAEYPARPSDAGEPDDVDRAFTRLAPLWPPRQFTATVLLAVQASQAHQLTRRHIFLTVADLTALVVLGFLAFGAGQALVGGGFVALASAFLFDQEFVAAMPGDALIALAEAVPWLELTGLVLMGFVVWTCTRALGRTLGEPPRLTRRQEAL